MKHLSTSQLAKAVGVHPNTVRRYEEKGFLPPARRSLSGYRRFTERHLDCLRLTRLVFSNLFPGKAIYESGIHIVYVTAGGDLGGALELAYHHLALVQSERAQAEAAVDLLERWALGAPADATPQSLTIGQTVRLLGVSIDILRSWDRNGLIEIPRDPSNGYRRYGAQQLSRLRVIRMLSRAGYSTGAILRMLIQLDRGETTDLRRALDTPRPDEDVYLASDRWLTALSEHEARARQIIDLLQEMIHKETRVSASFRE